MRLQGLAIPFITRADGTLVTMPPEQLPLKAEMANVPFIIGEWSSRRTVNHLLMLLKATSKTKERCSPSRISMSRVLCSSFRP